MTAVAADRPASTILAEINDALPKRPTNIPDKAAAQDNRARMNAGMKRRSDLIGELYASHPETPELADLLPWRWTGLAGSAEANREIRAQINDIIARSKQEPFLASAYYGLAMLAYKEARPETLFEEVMPHVDEFCRRFPKDDRGGKFLMALAEQEWVLERREQLWSRVLRDYSTPSRIRSIEAARKHAPTVERNQHRIGQPFPLDFIDAINGDHVSMGSLKGKVVVIDFWATWCGPCLAEMPRMKGLQEKYKGRGVQFIGVNTDTVRIENGRESMKKSVKEYGLDWPQYYQEDGIESKFLTEWAISSIPRVFVIDCEGNLVSIDARENLEALIAKCLETAPKPN
jgi:thiol-disulfide isomerase/thioredoxin